MRLAEAEVARPPRNVGVAGGRHRNATETCLSPSYGWRLKNLRWERSRDEAVWGHDEGAGGDGAKYGACEVEDDSDVRVPCASDKREREGDG